MPISRAVADSLENASWIRRMFEEGNRLKQIHGDDAVYDFTLGNPDLPPPEPLLAKLRELTQKAPEGMHRYMPNAGWPQVRTRVAEHLQERTGLPYSADHIVMTVGAGGALNSCLKAILDPGDEVILVCPFFVEYRFYVANHGGKCVEIEGSPEFGLCADKLEAAISPRTKAVIVNSPNNPSGRVYNRDELEEFTQRLAAVSHERGKPIYLITDEPYRKIIYDGVECPEIPPLYRDTILITSSSKDLGLAGERIGYLAVRPDAADAQLLVNACNFCNRTLGFVNAPSLFQLAVADCLDVTVDTDRYRSRRDLLAEHLRGLGFEFPEPEGAFYLFPKAPIPDDTQFVTEAIEERVLVVPGSGFGTPGHFRVSYAVPTETIERSLEAWTRVAARYPQLATAKR